MVWMWATANLTWNGGDRRTPVDGLVTMLTDYFAACRNPGDPT